MEYYTLDENHVPIGHNYNEMKEWPSPGDIRVDETNIKVDGDEYMIIGEDDILGVVEV